MLIAETSPTYSRAKALCLSKRVPLTVNSFWQASAMWWKLPALKDEMCTIPHSAISGLQKLFSYSVAHRREIFLSLAFASAAILALLYALHPGLRRTCQFWSSIAPLVAEYKVVNFQRHVDRWRGIPDAHHEARLQRFHERSAPKISRKMVRMGGIYIKLGQILSTVGSGFLNEAYVSALRVLQDGAPARPYADIVHIVESSTGRTMDEMFVDFEPTPIGAASIGQAHRATLRLPNGVDAGTISEPVIVKVQYPEVARSFQIDFDNLAVVTRWFEPEQVDLVESLRARHNQELDFHHEADNLRTVRRNLQRSGVEPTLVRIPMVRNETGICNNNVLVMEYLEGTSLASVIQHEQDRFAQALGKSDGKELQQILLARMKEHFEKGGGTGEGSLLAMDFPLLQKLGPGVTRLIRWYGNVRETAGDFAFTLRTASGKMRNAFGGTDNFVALKNPKRTTKVNLGRVLKTLVHVHGLQLMQDGVFNADPHPGNVLVLPDGRLGLLDYGMVGRVSEEDRQKLAAIVLSLAMNDHLETAKLYSDTGYKATWKHGDLASHPRVLHRFATFHFDKIDLSPIIFNGEKVGIMQVLESTRERSLPLWIENGRRLSGLLIGVASQATRPVSLAKEWKPIAQQVLRRRKQP
jgi:aarF domain-containing kinase